MALKDLLVCALVAAGVAAGTAFALVRPRPPPPANVPDLVGTPVAEARAALDRNDLLITISQEREDASVDPGQVLEQHPLAGSRLRRGESVTVVVARAPQNVEAPSLVGQPMAEARMRLDVFRLALGKVTEKTDEKIPAGHVVSQGVPARTEIRIGTAVDLVVSKGPETFAVPSVLSRPLARAREQIAKAGFKVGTVRYEMDDDAGDGLVLRQTPTPDQPVSKGAAVDLIVNRIRKPAAPHPPPPVPAATEPAPAEATEPLPVPTVLGARLPRAKDQLVKAGFTIGNIRYGVDEEAEEGVVLQQIPPGEQPAAKGTAVELVVNHIEQQPAVRPADK